MPESRFEHTLEHYEKTVRRYFESKVYTYNLKKYMPYKYISRYILCLKNIFMDYICT